MGSIPCALFVVLELFHFLRVILACKGWSEQSSVASSTEPSSPAISESYSRGQSSTEISSSVMSGDGPNLLPTAGEISKYFPKLDDDLNSVYTQLDLSTPQPEEVFFQEKGTAESLSSASLSSDISRADATKGTSIDSEIINDIDDDEATLLVDMGRQTTTEESAVIKRTCLPDTRNKYEKPLVFRVQKQISLVESERLAAAADKEQSQIPALNIRRRKFETPESSLLAQSSSNDSLSLERVPVVSNRSAKTKSCINLKSYVTAHHPGALLVKEMFIDPPKRVARSFHGKTGRERAEEQTGSDAPLLSNFSGSAHKLRFVTTKVDETKDK